jgi:hypothetical protein
LHGEKIAKKLQQRPVSAIANVPFGGGAAGPRPVLRPSSAANPIVKAPSNNNLILGAGAAALPKPPYDPARIYKNPISPIKKINPLRKSAEKKLLGAGAIVSDKKKPVDNVTNTFHTIARNFQPT